MEDMHIFCVFRPMLCLQSGSHYFMGIAHLVERLTEEPGTIPTWVRVPGAAMDVSPRVSFQCTLVRCPYSPRVQSHASASVRTLNIPNTGNDIIVWTHDNSTHIARNGWYCFCACSAFGVR